MHVNHSNSGYVVGELQQKAKNVVNYRQQKIQQLQTDKDYQIIRKKAELHYSEYREMRQQQLERGRRINALYRTKRTKEAVDTNKGPQLCVVIKGEYILFALLICCYSVMCEECTYTLYRYMFN